MRNKYLTSYNIAKPHDLAYLIVREFFMHVVSQVTALTNVLDNSNVRLESSTPDMMSTQQCSVC